MPLFFCLFFFFSKRYETAVLFLKKKKFLFSKIKNLATLYCFSKLSFEMLPLCGIPKEGTRATPPPSLLPLSLHFLTTPEVPGPEE